MSNDISSALIQITATTDSPGGPITYGFNPGVAVTPSSLSPSLSVTTVKHLSSDTVLNKILVTGLTPGDRLQLIFQASIFLTNTATNPATQTTLTLAGLHFISPSATSFPVYIRNASGSDQAASVTIPPPPAVPPTYNTILPKSSYSIIFDCIDTSQDFSFLFVYIDNSSTPNTHVWDPWIYNHPL